MIFDSKNKLVATVIQTQKFEETGWRDVEFTNINGNIEYLFGKTDGWSESKTTQGNIIWSWVGNKNELYSAYFSQGAFEGSYMVVTFNQKDFLDNIEALPNNSNQFESKTSTNDSNPYENNYSGKQDVITYAPILDRPDMSNGKTIGKAENNTVIVLEKVNEKYYKVKSGAVTGYMWAGWFK